MKKNFENELKTVVGKEGFTLAETLITVAILGVVAAITIPAIINHQTESANRTKLKKAMTTYEKALNQMIIENDLKTNQAINDFGSEGGSCANTTEYFKKVEGSGCRFKTADRIWWDISDIENPVISLKDEITAENADTMKTNAESLDSDRTSFAMIGRLDDTTGTFRINDNGFEQTNGSDEQKAYMTKLYNFMNKVENAAADGGEPELTFWDKCKVITYTYECCTDNTCGFCRTYGTCTEEKCTYTYDCPTAEDATKTCTADMTKVTFENKCVPILDCGTNPTGVISCPIESENSDATLDAAVVVLPDTDGMNWNDAKKACEDAGLELANAAQVKQLYNSNKENSTLEKLCENCSRDHFDNFWVAEEYSEYDLAFAFAIDNGYFYASDKNDNFLSHNTKVMCVGK